LTPQINKLQSYPHLPNLSLINREALLLEARR
jgi:hypothetical protein